MGDAVQRITREVAGAAVGAADFFQQARQYVDLAGQGRCHNQLFAVVDDLCRWVAFPGEALVEIGQRLFSPRIDKDAVGQVSEVVAHRAIHHPFPGELFAWLQNFFYYHIQRRLLP